jgi:TPR repeat protein
MFRRLVAAGAFALVLGTQASAQEAAQDAPDGCVWRSPISFTCTGPSGQSETVPAPFGFDRTTMAKARSGDAAAMELLAEFYGRGKPPRDLALYVEWIRKAAAGGDRWAMYRLGVVYFDGEGAPKDEAEAVRWFQRSADAGLAEAMAALGFAYATGRGVPKDGPQSARWLQAGAQAGSLWAMRNLAVSYEQGFGVPRDRSEAARWRQRADQAIHHARDPNDYEMQLAYPVEAAAAAIEGHVVLHCALDQALVPSGCVVEEETPEGMGFGEAALSLASTVRMLPGLAPGSEVRLPMAFKLGMGPEARPTTDRCAAYALAMERQTPFAGLSLWWSRYWQARSRLLARQAGEAEGLERLEPQVSEAGKRLAAGKDRGFFGTVGRCHLDE